MNTFDVPKLQRLKLERAVDRLINDDGTRVDAFRLVYPDGYATGWTQDMFVLLELYRVELCAKNNYLHTRKTNEKLQNG